MPLWCVKDAANYLAYADDKIYQLIDTHQLKAHRAPGGRRWRMYEADVQDYARRQHDAAHPVDLIIVPIPPIPPLEILLISDNPHDVWFCKQTVRQCFLNPLDITVHSDAQFALAALLAGHFKPDLILLDLSLSGMSGMTLLAAMRAARKDGRMPAESRQPILVFSSTSLPADLVLATELGADACYEKKLAFEPLVREVSRMLERWAAVARVA